MAIELNEASSRADLSAKMMEIANASLRHSRESIRSHAEEVAKLRDELEGERASRIEAAARLEEELNKARALQGQA